MTVYSLHTMVVGSGAAGFNAADSLYNLGMKDIAMITEGKEMGTSRNTGSDKQTYYKLTTAGASGDSIADMAHTLYDGGAMHGDIALVEAALSSRCFYKLVEIGVPFPHNRYGEYIGYRTDHDPKQRGTSAGPLTSRFMTEQLEKQVKQKNIQIFDRYLVIGIVTEPTESGALKSIGLLAINMNELEQPNLGFTLFNCTNIIYATGGPAGIYHTSVYPTSQIGGSGIAFEAGVKGINLTESQYGIASIGFRWNLSGSYQQVIPRYVSMNPDGSEETEFLNPYFPSAMKMVYSIFLKGYQWPFDVRKIKDYGSSLIDILVYYETQIKKRKVFLDFTQNSTWGSENGKIDFSLLPEEAYQYLKNSDALLDRPIDRLAKINTPAIELFQKNGIDLYHEYIEISVCAQHNNGGLVGNIWWESNIKNFFPVGEVNGTFGIYRPGGSALNSTQVGSLRAAQYIAAHYIDKPKPIEEFKQRAYAMVSHRITLAHHVIDYESKNTNVWKMRQIAQTRMTQNGACIRSLEGIRSSIEECTNDLKEFMNRTKISSVYEIPDVFRNRDILLTQLVYFYAIEEYIKKQGGSRGSFMISNANGDRGVDGLPNEFCYSLDQGDKNGFVCEMLLQMDTAEPKCLSEWKKVRPIPQEDNWFETVWEAYRSHHIIQ